MKTYSINKALALVMVAILFFGMGVADLCSKGSKLIDGNQYCQAVKSVKYVNVGKTAGIYQEVIKMDTTGTCEKKATPFTGRLAPFDEDLSLHLRGPINIKQFGAYTLNSHKSNTVQRGEFGFGHAHNHELAHKHQKAKKEMVIATIDGLVQSWENNWFGPDTKESPATTLATEMKVEAETTAIITVTATTSTTTCIVSDLSATKPTSTTSVNAPASTPASAPASADAANNVDTSNSNTNSKNAYSRTSYYDSVSQTTDNVVFLGNYGGQGSGVWDVHFGGSLSFVNSEGTSGSPTAQVLADTVIPSAKEITIVTGEKCTKHNCGYFRPGSVAYRGFAGADKVFLVEFGMPSDGKTGFQGDQPAIWLLNGKIPRTEQYGISHCNCWPECGEIDIVEALSPGSRFMKSTIHGFVSGGSSDYFDRPVQGTMTIATIFREDQVYIGVVPNGRFPDHLTSSDIDKMIGANTWSESDFAMS